MSEPAVCGSCGNGLLTMPPPGCMRPSDHYLKAFDPSHHLNNDIPRRCEGCEYTLRDTVVMEHPCTHIVLVGNYKEPCPSCKMPIGYPPSDRCNQRDKHIYPTFLREEKVDHPSHYGGDTTYEAIKVITAWGLNFSLGSVLKYVCRAGKKDGADELEDLRKARWYLDNEIKMREKTRNV